MTPTTSRWCAALGMVAALGLAGCGSDDDNRAAAALKSQILANNAMTGSSTISDEQASCIADGAVEKLGVDLDMTVQVDKGHGDNQSRRNGRSHVTVLGTPLTARAMSAITGRIADVGANIDRIERMARYPITAIDLHVSGAAPEKLRDILTREAAQQGVDIAVQAANLMRRGMRLIAATGWGQEKDRQRAFDAGFDHHLTKPIDFEHLRSVLGPGPRQ